MFARLAKTCFALLLALFLTAASAPPMSAQPGDLSTASSGQESMPDDLMSAYLAAAAEPFAATASGFQAYSGDLEVSFASVGWLADASGIPFGLRLTAFGRAGQTEPLPDSELTHHETMLEYHRGTLREWYRDTPLGLQQGFNIHEEPGGVGPLVLELAVSPGVAVAVDEDRHGLSLTTGGPVIRYDQLRATDAAGAPLLAQLSHASGQISLQVDSAGAAYPLAVTTLIYVHEQKLLATGAADNRFGSSVSLSGNTALVGAPLDDVGANGDQGAAYVFTRTGSTWTFEQQLVAPDGAADDQFGASVSLSGDTALVGAPFADLDSNGNQRSAYVFTRTGTTWSFQQQLTAPGGAANDQFGYAVSLSGDTALVGAVYDDVGTNARQGSAYVFVRSGTSWTFQQQLTAPDGAAHDLFGFSVSLSGDTALVGVPYDNVGANPDQGSAYIFVRNGTTWTFQQQLIAPDGAADDYFAGSLSLSGDTALFGAPFDKVGANYNQGSAYVFTRSGATWSFQQQLTAPDGAAFDYFGSSVSLSGDTALLGVPSDNVGANPDQGSAYVFVRNGTTWTFQQHLTASDGATFDVFGWSVSLSGDTALVGVPGDDFGGNTSQGSVHFYRADATPYVISSTRAGLTPTPAATVDFTVTFSEPVIGVDASDFALDTTGSLSGPSISNVSGSGATYTVTVATGTGCGTLRLDLPLGATVTDLAGLLLSGLPYTSGEAYTILCVVYLPQVVNSGS